MSDEERDNEKRIDGIDLNARRTKYTFCKVFYFIIKIKEQKEGRFIRGIGLAFCLFVRKLFKKYIKDNVCTKILCLKKN